MRLSWRELAQRRGGVERRGVRPRADLKVPFRRGWLRLSSYIFRSKIVSHSTAAQYWSNYAPAGLFLVTIGPEQDILPIIKQQAEGSRHDAHIAVEVLRPSRWCRRRRTCDGILVVDGDDFAQVDGEYRLLGHGIPGDQIATNHLEVTSSRDLQWISRQLDAFADLM